MSRFRVILSLVIKMTTAKIFSIEEFSTFDGPGIRTTVFLKGCPLRCSWCHNPEGQSFEDEVIKAQGCVNCGACQNGQYIERCPKHLLRNCSQEYTPKELISELEGSFEYLIQAGGGITFSGGEPLSHPRFLSECLALLQGRIHTAIQTSGYAPSSQFASVLTLADYVLFDLKLMDEQQHLEYTGVSNRLILENFSLLSESGKQFVVRTPLIPRVTDTAENLQMIAECLKFHNVDTIELLPYNKSAGGKYGAIGREYTPRFDEALAPTPRIELFRSYGIHAKLL